MGERTRGGTWLWISVLFGAAVILGYVTGAIPRVLVFPILVVGVVTALAVRGLRARQENDRETEERLYGGPALRVPWSRLLVSLGWTAIWLVVVIFLDEILISAAAVVASWLESLGFAPEAGAVEGLLRALVFVLIAWSWIEAWAQSRRDRALQSERVHGGGAPTQPGAEEIRPS